MQVHAVNSIFTRFIAFNTSNIPSGEAEAEYKPDVTIYKRDGEQPLKRATTSFQTMEMFVEFKHGKSADPFATDDNIFPKIFNNTRVIRGQITLYSTRQQAYQFRTSLFNVGIFGKVARLFRWDRTGCQVTEPIEYSTKKGNRQLVEFFQRLDQLADKPEARGWDPTVEDAKTSEAEDFNNAVGAICRTRTRTAAKGGGKTTVPLFHGLTESIGDPNKYLRRKVKVGDRNSNSKFYIVGRPVSVLKAPTGRASRGFVAMAVDTKRLVFLKDSWRPDIKGILPESHWYDRLRKEKSGGMKFIGAYSRGSDVFATKEFIKCTDHRQRTLTHLFGHQQTESMIGYIHHRVIESELYLPLKMFRNSKHLTEIMGDTINGTLFQVIQGLLIIDTPYRSYTCTQGRNIPPGSWHREHHD